MSNGVGLHCPDLTAGTPVYAPDELELEDPDAHRAPEPAPPAGPGAAERGAANANAGVHLDLIEAAREGGYRAATVVVLCRCYYDQPRLAELDDAQPVDMAGRLRLAPSRDWMTSACGAWRRRG